MIQFLTLISLLVVFVWAPKSFLPYAIVGTLAIASWYKANFGTMGDMFKNVVYGWVFLWIALTSYANSISFAITGKPAGSYVFSLF